MSALYLSEVIQMRKLPFEKEYSNTAAIAKNGTGELMYWYIPVTAVERDLYGPFTQLRIHNKTTSSDVKVIINHDTETTYLVGPGEIINILDATFSFVTIQNQDTVNGVAIGKIKVRISNQVRA